jgi:CubicO group peptidase (beta-lactamase class C family)
VDKNILKPLGMTKSYFDRAPYFLEKNVSGSYLRAGTKLTEQPFNFDSGITVSNSGLKAPLTDMVKYLRFLIGEEGNATYEMVLKRSSLEEAWRGTVPVREPAAKPTAYTSTDGGVEPRMGLGFFVLETGGHRYVYHDGDQGGFSSELFVEPAARRASLLVVNTTDTGVPVAATSTELRPQTNTEPDPNTDLRLTLRKELLGRFFAGSAQ